MKLLALLLNLVGLPAILGGLWMAIFTPMLFDAPGSTESWSTKTLAICILLLPLLLIIAEIFGWKNYWAGDYWGAIKSYTLVLIDILIIAAIFMKGGSLT